MNANFDKAGFEKAFASAIKKLARAEKVTKELLRDVSRTVLEAHHATENVAYINQLIPILTPMNRKVAILFYKEFSGFQWDDETKRFTKKSKKVYDGKHAAAMAFLADPHQNIWTWAERNVEVERKPAAPLLDKVKETVQDWLKKAEKSHVSQAEILEAVFGGGIDPGVVINVFEKMGLEFAELEPGQKPDEPALF